MSEVPAFTNFQDIQKQSKVQIEALAAASASFAEKLQSIASEAKDYSIKSFENSRKFSEKLLRAKNINDVVQAQADFAKAAQEDFVAQATKIADLYSRFAKEIMMPLTGPSKD
jgi:hypothetical protein